MVEYVHDQLPEQVTVHTSLTGHVMVEDRHDELLEQVTVQLPLTGHVILAL